MTTKKLTREAIAHSEIGSTRISKSLAIALSSFFLLAIFLVPAAQYTIKSAAPLLQDVIATVQVDLRGDVSPFDRVDRRNTSFLKGLDILETRLEEESFLRSLFLPPLQSFLLKFLGRGNEKVVVGRDGWLFFRPGVDAIIGQPFLDKNMQRIRYEGHELWEKPVQPDPVLAIAEFSNQLREQGIELLVVPVPVKPSIHPEKLTSNDVAKPLTNRSWEDFLRQLNNSNVEVFDSRGILAEYAQKHGAAYLTTDTHWLPGAMDEVAKELAVFIQQRFPKVAGIEEYETQPKKIEAEGDVSRMLTLSNGTSHHLQTVEIHQVVNAESEFWQPTRDAEVLLLGDSFTNIYSASGLGWGMNAGFAEHVSYHLRAPLDLIAKNDSGAYVTREALSQDLARGRDRLDGKKLVIWEFAERELSLGDWKIVDLTLGTHKESGFFAAEVGQAVRVHATVEAISRSPRPGSVPYRDNVLTLHLVDIKGRDVEVEADQALVYALGMKDNVLTGMANLRPGDELNMTLSAWDEVEGEYGSFRRSPLDDEMMELELPSWGVIDNDKKN